MNRIDIKGGQMTFSQRIELGKVITDPALSEFEKFRGCMLCIDPAWNISMIKSSLDYWEEVLEGIQHWMQREAVELKYNPTPEELVAGIELLSRRVGEMNTIMAIAEKFGQDPDDILEWKYGKVFNILFSNLQSFLYRTRLEKQYTKKAKAEAQKGNRGSRKR